MPATPPTHIGSAADPPSGKAHIHSARIGENLKNRTGCLPRGFVVLFWVLQCLPIIMHVHSLVYARGGLPQTPQDNRFCLLAECHRYKLPYIYFTKSIGLYVSDWGAPRYTLCWLMWSAEKRFSKWRNWPWLICDLCLRIRDAPLYMGKYNVEYNMKVMSFWLNNTSSTIHVCFDLYFFLFHHNTTTTFEPLVR